MANSKKTFTIPSSGGITSFTYDLRHLSGNGITNITWTSGGTSNFDIPYQTSDGLSGYVEVSAESAESASYVEIYPTDSTTHFKICNSVITIRQDGPQNEEPSTNGSCDCDDFKIGKIYVSEECGCDGFHIRAIYVDESCTCDGFYIKNIYVDESCNCGNFFIKSIYVDESCNCSGFYIKSITVE